MRLAFVVMRHEVSELARNKQLIIPITIFPLIVSIIVPVVGVQYESLAGFYETYIGAAFIPMFLMIPVALPTSISAYSIVGEREAKTIEPLLATPITNAELLVGKSLTAFVVSQVLTWLSFCVFALISFYIGHPVDLALWGVIMFALSPFLTMFGIIGMTLLSVHAKGVREAQELGVFVMIPMLMILVATVTQTISLKFYTVSGMVLLFLVLNVLLVCFGLRTFNRERLVV